jgi:hypothetical protein
MSYQDLLVELSWDIFLRGGVISNLIFSCLPTFVTFNIHAAD